LLIGGGVLLVVDAAGVGCLTPGLEIYWGSTFAI
jgi:hypothetical protein